MVNVSNNQKNYSILFLLIFGLLAFWSNITQSTLWGTVYTNVFYAAMILIFLSYISPKIAEYDPVSNKNLFAQIIIGFALGIVLVGSLLFKGSHLSFLSPLSIPNTSNILGILGLSAVSFVFVNSIVISEFEETLRSSTLRPSVFEWLNYGGEKGFAFILFLIGIIVYFVIGMKLIGLSLAAFALIAFFKRLSFIKRIDSKMVRWGISIIFVGLFFALLHLTAYSKPGANNASALMFNAFLYAVIADTIDTFYDSTIPSKIAHTLNNAAIASVAVGIPVGFAFVVAGVHALAMGMIARS